jgi:hypothetical protein
MLTPDDIHLIEKAFDKRIEVFFDKKFTEQQIQIKTLVREEIQRELRDVKTDIKMIDLKVEAFNVKLDRVNNEISETLGDVSQKLSQYHDLLVQRVTKLEKHAKFSH